MMTNHEHLQTTLLLARHGETEANLTGVWQGSTDSPLNARGQGQSQALAERLAAEGRAIAAIYSSPLSRALETASIIARRLDHHQVCEDAGLVEFDLGEWEGLSYEDLRFEKRLWARMAEDPTFAPPGGESAVAFALRLAQSLRTITKRHRGETVLVVSHGGALATALAMILHGDGNLWTRYMLANCSLSELVMAAEPRLLRCNDTSHLDHATRPRSWGAD